MSVFDHRCADCSLCPSCGRAAWCEGDRILTIPCEHHGYCGDCNLTHCPACQTEAMSGDDWQDADPLYRPPVESREAYLTRTRNPHYDTRTNTHRRQA